MGILFSGPRGGKPSRGELPPQHRVDREFPDDGVVHRRTRNVVLSCHREACVQASTYMVRSIDYRPGPIALARSPCSEKSAGPPRGNPHGRGRSSRRFGGSATHGGHRPRGLGSGQLPSHCLIQRVLPPEEAGAVSCGRRPGGACCWLARAKTPSIESSEESRHVEIRPSGPRSGRARGGPRR